METETAPARLLPDPDDFIFRWRCDSGGVLTDISENFQTLTGLDPARFLLPPGGAVPHPAIPDGTLAGMRTAAERGEAFQGLELVLSDGRAACKLLLSGRAGGVAGKDGAGGGGFAGVGLCAAGPCTAMPGSGEGAHNCARMETAQSVVVGDSLLLARMQDVGKVGFSELDPANGNIRVFGPLRDILGVSDENADIGQVKAKLLKEDVGAYDAARMEAAAGMEPVRVELRFGLDCSDCRHLLVQFEPILDADNSLVSLFTVYQDITEHRSVEKTLLEAQKIGRMGHWRCGGAGQDCYRSETLRDILGLAVGVVPAPETCGSGFMERFVHPEDLPEYRHAREHSLRTGQDYEVVVRVVRPAGGTIWAVIRERPVFDPAGTNAGTVGTIQDITAHKELEQRLLRSDGWFRRAQRLAGIGHWTFDAGDGRIRFSEEAQRIFDCVGIGSLPLREVRKRIHPDDWPVFDAVREQVRACNPGLDLEVRLRHSAGGTAFLKIAAEFDYDSSGVLTGAFGTMLDTTPRVRAEAARQEVEFVMTDIFENTDSGILVRDLSGRFIRANTRAAIQLGLRIDDILGHTVEDVVARSKRMESAEQLHKAAATAIRTRHSITYDYSHMPEGGGPATEFRVVSFPITGIGGTVHAIASMRYDITGFVQAQTELKRLNEDLEQTVRTRTQELRRSEERFRNIASASADWLWELDADLDLIWCSDNFFEEIGRRPEDFLGNPLTVLADTGEPSAEQQEQWATFTRRLKAGRPVRGLELQWTHRMGLRTVRINASPVRSDGKFLGYQGSASDVTELKQAQARLMETERLASLGGLVAGISHEINTPVGASFTVVTKLTRSLTELQNAYEAKRISRSMFARFLSEQGEGLGIIRRGLERTSELISHFKQIAVDQTSYKRRDFALPDLVRDIVATMEATIGSARNVSIKAEIPADIRLDSYPGPLGQVLINLIQNSILHAFDDERSAGAEGTGKGSTEEAAALDIDEAGVGGRIRIEAERSGTKMLTLKISDNGKGMAPNVVRRVFEPFFTTRLGRGGSGLGMHLVYSIVNGVLGGTVSVTSRPGVGTSVRVWMPLVSPGLPQERSDGQPGGDGQPGEGSGAGM